MVLVIVSFALIVFYTCAIPVKIALHLHIGEKIRFTSGVAIFEGRFADRLAEKHANGKKKPPMLSRWIKNTQLRIRLSACMAGLRHFYRHVKIDAISAEGVVSAADAASTALICGTATALSAALKKYCSVSIRLRPDFSAGHSCVIVRGMFSIRAGHIILAAAIGTAHYIKGGIAQWKNTRSKTS